MIRQDSHTILDMLHLQIFCRVTVTQEEHLCCAAIIESAETPTHTEPGI